MKPVHTVNADAAPDEEMQLTDSSEEELISFFKHFAVSDENRISLKEALQKNVDIRRTWLKDGDINIHDRFSFYYVEPELVSHIHIKYELHNKSSTTFFF